MLRHARCDQLWVKAGLKGLSDVHTSRYYLDKYTTPRST